MLAKRFVSSKIEGGFDENKLEKTPKTVKGWNPWDLFNVHSVAKIEGGPFGDMDLNHNTTKVWTANESCRAEKAHALSHYTC